MQSRYRTTRRRRPLSMGEVGLFAFLIVLVFGIGLYRPANSSTASARQSGLTLMNVTTADPFVTVKPDAPAVVPVAPTSSADSQTVTEQAVAAETQELVMFDGRPLRKVRQMTMLTTAYSPDERSCGKWADGFTASGYSVWTNGMKLVAADTRVLPFGTLVSIPGYNGGRPVPVLDRGAKIKGNHLDLLYPTHERALQWGAQRLVVDIWEYAD